MTNDPVDEPPFFGEHEQEEGPDALRDEGLRAMRGLAIALGASVAFFWAPLVALLIWWFSNR